MDSKIRREVEKLKTLIEDGKKIYISSHVRPDGDSIGSILGLGAGLKKQYPEKDIKVCIKDEVPEYLKFLDTTVISQVDSYEDADMLIILDCGDKSRIGIDSLEKIKTVVNIDHHMTNPGFGDVDIVVRDASSTSEIVYDVLEMLGIEVDMEIAKPIYTGISTDTGSFKYQSTGARTHEIAAKLLKTGLDTEKIVRELYQSKTINEMLLIKEGMENLELIKEGRVALLLITDEILEKSGMDAKEVDSIVEVIRDIDTVELACVLKPFEEKTKISIRSKENFDASELAQQFGGGGHLRAAGCKIDRDMYTAREMILKAIDERI